MKYELCKLSKIGTHFCDVLMNNDGICCDMCLAQEIKELNHIHKVETISSCCGNHVDCSVNGGSIVVRLDNAQKMLDLGYKQIGLGIYKAKSI